MNIIKLSENLDEKLKKTKEFLDELKACKSFKDKIELCEYKLERIGKGSSRLVYKLFDNTVIKVAKNNKGIAQNKIEASQKEINQFMNRVLYFSDDHSFLRAGYADKITEQEFKKITGYAFKDFAICLKYALKNLTKKEVKDPDKNIYSKIKDEPFFEAFVKFANKLNLVPGDLGKISSYGNKNGRLVMIDFGLSREIYEKFYKNKT